MVYGSSDYFPGFYVPKSPYKVSFAYDSIEKIAEVISMFRNTSEQDLGVSDQLESKNGHLIACPIPEEYAADGAMIEEAIERATLEAR